MDKAKMKNWVSYPGVCRFCLSTSGTWDMTIYYISESGMKEMYMEMLQECYGLTLSNVTEWGTSRMVCGPCVDQLRDAYLFKKRVQQAEAFYTEYCASNDQLFPQWINIDMQTLEFLSPDTDNITCNAILISDDGNNITWTQNVLDETLLGESGLWLNTQMDDNGTGKDSGSYNEIDSNTPITTLTTRDNVPNNLNVESDKMVPTDTASVDTDDSDGVPDLPLKNTKRIPERRRLKQNCEAVLRGSNACPFRHHRSWFQCFYCTQDFMDITQLRKHNTDAHSNLDNELQKIKRFPRSLQVEITNLQCRHCGCSLTDIESLRRHLFAEHKEVIYSECIVDYKIDVSPYSCHLCERQFHVFRTLTTHLNEHYANCICDVCGKSFLNSKRLKVHKRTHEHGNYPCPECGKVLKTKNSITNHMESAHSRRVLKCQICSKPMKHYNERVKHMSEEHDITHKFKCPVCPREYNVKHYLAAHVRQTHGIRNKKCDICGMAFITNYCLKKHMERHTSIKPQRFS